MSESVIATNDSDTFCDTFSAASGKAAPAVAARALAEAMEALALEPPGDTGKLWGGAGGEAAASLIAAIIEDGDGLPAVTATGFSALVDTLLAGETVRTGAGLPPPPAHPGRHRGAAGSRRPDRAGRS